MKNPIAIQTANLIQVITVMLKRKLVSSLSLSASFFQLIGQLTTGSYLPDRLSMR